MITTRIQIDKQTDMSRKTKCSLEQTMVTEHYSLVTDHYSPATDHYSPATDHYLPACLNSFQTDLRKSRQIETDI